MTKNYPGLSPAPQRHDLFYDNADQLLRAPLKDATTNTLLQRYIYGYDLAANRTSEQIGPTVTTSTPNNVNEIVSQSGGTNRTLSYDLNGSITNDGLTRTFEWDGANRLIAINYTGTTNRSEFTYDGLSRCAKIVEKTNGSVTSTRKFVWSGMDKCEFRDAGDVVTDFVYPQGQYSAGVKYFYTRDHLGSIREMFKNNGIVVARYDYDPWGRSTTVINTTLPDFNFTGLYRHSTSNLDMAVHRFYDPDLGRWLSRDPIGERGGINLYGYVGNRPLRLADPLGLEVDEPFPGESGTLGTQRGSDVATQAPAVVNGVIRDAAIDVAAAVLPELGFWERLLNLLRWGKKCEKAAEYGSTPAGRPWSAHYANDTAPVRELPGSVIDNTIDTVKGIPAENGKTVFYDPINNVTVVTGDGGVIVSARKGKPRSGQY